jgi:hypothetical protein
LLEREDESTSERARVIACETFTGLRHSLGAQVCCARPSPTRWPAAGRVVFLTGEPTIGKTRAAAEFAKIARRAAGGVLWGPCYDAEWAPPFGPFAEAIAVPTQLR